MHRNTNSNSSSSSGKSPMDKADLRQRRQVLMSGLITAVGIGLHNFPEGVAVFLAAHKCQALGEQ
jgi:ZIP family zinc transporter